MQKYRVTFLFWTERTTNTNTLDFNSLSELAAWKSRFMASCNNFGIQEIEVVRPLNDAELETLRILDGKYNTASNIQYIGREQICKSEV
jgi:putative component of membrane protein insertase Oxa1/YidC/SpoIIIJ protein YidD